MAINNTGTHYDYDTSSINVVDGSYSGIEQNISNMGCKEKFQDFEEKFNNLDGNYNSIIEKGKKYDEMANGTNNIKDNNLMPSIYNSNSVGSILRNEFTNIKECEDQILSDVIEMININNKDNSETENTDNSIWSMIGNSLDNLFTELFGWIVPSAKAESGRMHNIDRQFYEKLGVYIENDYVYGPLGNYCVNVNTNKIKMLDGTELVGQLHIDISDKIYNDIPSDDLEIARNYFRVLYIYADNNHKSPEELFQANGENIHNINTDYIMAWVDKIDWENRPKGKNGTPEGRSYCNMSNVTLATADFLNYLFGDIDSVCLSSGVASYTVDKSNDTNNVLNGESYLVDYATRNDGGGQEGERYSETLVNNLNKNLLTNNQKLTYVRLSNGANGKRIDDFEDKLDDRVYNEMPFDGGHNDKTFIRFIKNIAENYTLE